jgi:hypothetical protein
MTDFGLKLRIFFRKQASQHDRPRKRTHRVAFKKKTACLAEALPNKIVLEMGLTALTFEIKLTLLASLFQTGKSHF